MFSVNLSSAKIIVMFKFFFICRFITPSYAFRQEWQEIFRKYLSLSPKEPQQFVCAVKNITGPIQKI